LKRETPSPHQHVENITAASHVYRIRVNGTADGTNTRDPIGYGSYDQAWESNLSVRMENIGDELVESPWIVVNGRRSWRTIDDILGEILEEGMSDAEKARAIWEFARHHRYHTTTADDEVKDTVKMLNVYGYTLCWDEAYTVANLWQAAGLEIRRGVPHGHCTTEVFYDGRYHLLDSDEHLLVLLRDNETIAGEEEIARDHDLMKRSHAYGILSPEKRRTSEQAASVFVHTGPRSGGRPFVGDHRMEIDLRPGESLAWEWSDRGKYHGHGRRPPRLSNGRLQFVPRLDSTFATWTEEAANLQATENGLRPLDPKKESLLVYRLSAPYVMVGGSVGLDASWSLEFSRDGDHWSAVDAEEEDRLLDLHLPHDGLATYCCYLRLRGVGQSLPHLTVEIDLQMAPLSLPALEVGDNEISYSDKNPGSRQLRITHTWLERDDSTPPLAPSHPLFPEPGADVDGTQFTFSWEAVPDATDYHFHLGPTEDLQYVLSPTFEKLISKTPSAGKAEWRIPCEGLLNSGQTYYWQIRSRNADGLWGAWSPVWSFIPQGPGVPLDPQLEIDWAERRIALNWRPNPQGSPVDYYEVYGSDERGFTASHEPYAVFTGRDQEEEIFPANLLATANETRLIVVAPDIPENRGNRAFYRIVAVDAQGRRSGPSDFVEAPRPFIHTLPPQNAVAGQTCTYLIKALRSTGDLRCISDGPHRYFSAFRDGDEPRFLLDEAPSFIHLDANTGLLTAAPGPEHLGYHTITFRVQNGQGGVDLQGFDLEIIAL
jgi:hypothetical protein